MIRRNNKRDEPRTRYVTQCPDCTLSLVSFVSEIDLAMKVAEHAQVHETNKE